jgi:hypothetical protein
MFKKYKKLFIVILIFLGVYLFLWSLDFSNKDQVFGITFSETYAKSLGLDSKEAYLAILNELNFQKLRLIAYWPEIEPQKNEFNFSYLDFQINEAQKRNKDIILVIGFRVPRWPECHIPKWAQNLNENDFRKELLNYIKKVVEYYKENKAILAWQVENEPFLKVFGICPPPNKNLFQTELILVKYLDQRPILLTDSGELSTWFNTAGKSEIFGTTLYRIVWNKYTGFFKHYIPPSIYTLRAWIVKKFTPTKKIIIAELQTEPWIPNSNISPQQQAKIFTLKDFKENISFARKTGIQEIYLWGAEWWYFQKLNHNPSYWEEAKKIQ